MKRLCYNLRDMLRFHEYFYAIITKVNYIGGSYHGI